MLKTINLKSKLEDLKRKSNKKDSTLLNVQQLFLELDDSREQTLQNLTKGAGFKPMNQFDVELLESQAIFHISHIKELCVRYRLRFLETEFFKGDYPAEAITKIHEFERDHNTQLSNFKIVAPASLFRLKKADDPLLFTPLGNDYYYLLYQWGNDLHPLRRLKYWAVKSVDTLIVTVLGVCLLFTALSYTFFFRQESSVGYFILLFFFYFKGAVGLGLFYGIALGKNFSKYAWNSQYDKVT